MLLATELQHGARGIGKSGVTPSNPTPRLSELGLTKKESAQAQQLAELPQETFEQIKTGKKTRKMGEMLGLRKECGDAP
jgi:hypothetical protein